MFNNKFMKILGSCLFLFILCFSLSSYAFAGEIGIDKVSGEKSSGSVNPAPVAITDLDDDDEDDDDDVDDSDEDDDDSDEEEYEPLCYHWDWKEFNYCIPIEFNLTDDELTELFTKRDVLREEIANLRLIIEKMQLSRNEDILLTIDELFVAINKITNNSEFNELLLSLKEINITELNSSFNDLKSLLESIKEEYPDEDFTEIDLLMEKLESLINEELESYENLTFELKDKIVELFELYEKYPFLGQDVFKSVCGDHVWLHADSKFVASGYGGSENDKNNNVSASMKNTGMPFFALVLLILFSFIGLNFKRKF